MKNLPASASGVASAAVRLFRQATATGRMALNGPERHALLDMLGVKPVDSQACAVELRVTLSNTREFGMLINAGLGGIDGRLPAGLFGRHAATACAACELTNASDFLDQFRNTLAYARLLAVSQENAHPAPDAALEQLFTALLELAGQCTAEESANAFALHKLELDGLSFAGETLASEASCQLAEPPTARLARPVHKIDKLLHPGSIGIIGVSATSMNFGRIILRNLAASGYRKEQMSVIRPGESEIDGIKCVESLQALDHKLDLLIVAVAADAVHGLVDEIIDSDAVESVMLIPGGLGETEKSREPAARLAARINAAHGKPDGGPIFLGANCLGVVSHPGAYDSWFIPLERLPKPAKKPQRNSVMLSQSGAFMITRLSQNPWLDPRYMLALGNQTDLTHGDLMGYFAELPEIETIGVYIEGFKDLDGLAFARAVRRAVCLGKQVVVYKAGKTSPGMAAVMGHTASIAGDPAVFEAVVRQAGAIVAEDFNSFDDLFYIAGALHDKKVAGRRLGAISGAGFEAVGMADTIAAETTTLEMGELHGDTLRRVQEILVIKRLDTLVEVRNPIDINPGADDEAHLQITEAFLDDAGVDAVVVGLDPTAPSVRALQTSLLRPGYDLGDAKSSVHLMPALARRSVKPLVGIIDGGHLYDAMAAQLMDQGVCVFRNCARGTRALARYIEARLQADRIRAAKHL